MWRTIGRLLAVALIRLHCAAQDAGSASVAGFVMAAPGDPVAGAKVELHSQMRTFEVAADQGLRINISGAGRVLDSSQATV